ncbi:MAG: GGDEF domain-containing protein [Elusimicrobia bacterium]|nr:GGDEF domain-containing protein [Elusimicrobiota bacterium]
MVEERRDEESQAPTAGLPHTVLYPLLGSLVGLGSPVGALVVRWLLARPDSLWLWLARELSEEKVFYWYMGLGTVLSFAAFGWAVGRRSERQRARNAALRARIRELHLTSITDGLTGAYSHAYLQEALQVELESSRADGRSVSILMLDLDDFKKINDTHGHLFGDQVLREVTETIAANIRQADVLGRYGGEEFVVIMPGADAATALRVAERVRLAVSRSPVSPPHSQPVPVRVSIGFATSAGRDIAARSLLHEADENLYRAKNAGKNRTVGAGAETAVS